MMTMALSLSVLEGEGMLPKYLQFPWKYIYIYVSSIYIYIYNYIYIIFSNIYIYMYMVPPPRPTFPAKSSGIYSVFLNILDSTI